MSLSDDYRFAVYDEMMVASTRDVFDALGLRNGQTITLDQLKDIIRMNFKVLAEEVAAMRADKPRKTDE